MDSDGALLTMFDAYMISKLEASLLMFVCMSVLDVT